jgi:hypothetical protein
MAYIESNEKIIYISKMTLQNNENIALPYRFSYCYFKNLVLHEHIIVT